VTTLPGDWMALAMLFLRSVLVSMGIGVDSIRFSSVQVMLWGVK
jgi:hypothetical protein